MAESSGRFCGKCGYDLTGIKGLRGTCPECGNFWDALTGKGFGDDRTARRSRQDRIVARIRTVAIALFGVCLLLCGGAASLFAQGAGGNPWRPIAIGGLLAAVAFLAAATSYAYEDEG